MSLKTGTPATKTDSPSGKDEVRALVSIAQESADQVRLADGSVQFPMRVRAVRENGFELVGPVFLPRQCHLLVALGAGEADTVEGLYGLPEASLPCVVRKAQMVATEPVYSIWVQLAAPDPVLLATLGRLLGS